MSIKVCDRGREKRHGLAIVRDNIRASDLVVGDMDARGQWRRRIGAERMAELDRALAGLDNVRPACTAFDGSRRAADAAGHRCCPTA